MVSLPALEFRLRVAVAQVAARGPSSATQRTEVPQTTAITLPMDTLISTPPPIVVK